MGYENYCIIRRQINIKFIKTIIAVFILSIIFAISGANAEISIGFHEVSIPAVKGIFRSNQYFKSRENNNTYFYTQRTDRPTHARTYAYFNNIGFSEWANSKAEDYSYWSDMKSIVQGQYRFEVQTNSRHLSSTKYWGFWVYDPA